MVVAAGPTPVTERSREVAALRGHGDLGRAATLGAATVVGEARGIGPPPGGGVEGQLVDVEPAQLAEGRTEGVGPRSERQAVGVGAAQGDGERLTVEGGGGDCR